MPTTKLTVKPVTKASWPDLEQLFEAKGGPKYCWCMAWRDMPDRTHSDNADRKKALHERVLKRTPIGLLGYVAGEPVAWCSVAPRKTFLTLADQRDESERDVWSVTCFFIRRDHRNSGLSARMLEEACAYAKKRGAKIVEGYPVLPSSPSYRYMGFIPLFKSHGFRAAGKAGTRRHVMRRAS